MGESVFTLYKNEKRWDSSLILKKNIMGISIEKVKEYKNSIEVFIESNDSQVNLNVDNLKFLKDTFKSYDEIILNIWQTIQITVTEDFNDFKGIKIKTDKCYFKSIEGNLYNLNIECNTFILTSVYMEDLKLECCCLNCRNIMINSKVDFFNTYINNCYSIVDNCWDEHLNNDPLKLLKKAECVLSGSTLYKKYYAQSPIDFDDSMFREFRSLSNLYDVISVDLSNYTKTSNISNMENDSNICDYTSKTMEYPNNLNDTEQKLIELTNNCDGTEQKLIELANNFGSYDWRTLYYKLQTDGFTLWELADDYQYKKLTTDEIRQVFLLF